MKWEDYYDKFYEWSESTQINRISSLTDFGSFDEILEITENLDEKGASKLIRKALSQNIIFTAEQVAALSEYIEKELLSALIKSCKGPFTPDQLLHIENYSMLYGTEIQALVSAPFNFDNLTWDAYYNIFYELSDYDKICGANAIRDFSENEEVIEVMLDLIGLNGAENFIFKALDNGVVLSISDIDELIEYDNKNINRRLIFDNLERLKSVINTDDRLENLEFYMYPDDFRMLLQRLGYIVPTHGKPQKTGFLASIGIGVLGVKAFDHIFRDKDKKE